MDATCKDKDSSFLGAWVGWVGECRMAHRESGERSVAETGLGTRGIEHGLNWKFKIYMLTETGNLGDVPWPERGILVM